MKGLTSMLMVLVGILASCQADFTGCDGRSRLGGDCDYDSDCNGFALVCRPTSSTNDRKTCQCHEHYKAVKVSRDGDGNYRYACYKLQEEIGGSCYIKDPLDNDNNRELELGCRQPLQCVGRECKCLERGDRKLVNGRCTQEFKVGDKCEGTCSQPFSACINGRCQCIAGTASDGRGGCKADKQCPLGGKAGKACARLPASQSIYENVLNDKSTGSATALDSCPAGEYCVTAGEDLQGFCCKATCPLDTEVETQYSCIPGAANQCPTTTHYCNRVSGNYYAFAVCCRRPCARDSVDSVYVDGKCQPRGYLDGPCEEATDCDAAQRKPTQTMVCDTGTKKCKCRHATYFVPSRNIFTDDRLNPPQVCERKCGDNNERGREALCFGSASLGGKCAIQEQCPDNAGCFRGRCECRCGYIRSGTSRCVPKPTEPPKTNQGISGGTGTGILPGIGGNGGSDLLSGIFDKILSGAGSG